MLLTNRQETLVCMNQFEDPFFLPINVMKNNKIVEFILLLLKYSKYFLIIEPDIQKIYSYLTTYYKLTMVRLTLFILMYPILKSGNSILYS